LLEDEDIQRAPILILLIITAAYTQGLVIAASTVAFVELGTNSELASEFG